jgi:hypothetical protein
LSELLSEEGTQGSSVGNNKTFVLAHPSA